MKRFQKTWALVMAGAAACSSGDASNADEPMGGEPIGDAGAEMRDADMMGDDNGALDYADDAHWLCKPGMSNDRCAALDLATSVASGDGTFVSEDVPVADDARVDCFYVYPTVDQRQEPGNTLDLSNLEPAMGAVKNQVARFRSVCRTVVPVYRQMTIGTYGAPGGYTTTDAYDLAFADVDAAFDHYLDEVSDGRPFVLMGHSQGSHMLTRLIRERIETDDALLARMVSALLIGPVGVVFTPVGEIVGGTFDKVPLCTSERLTGCVVAFDTKAASEGSTAPSNEFARACVDPTQLASGRAGVLSAAVFEANSGVPLPAAVVEPWVSFPDATLAACEADGLLGLRENPDADAAVPVTPSAVQDFVGGRSLHVVDFNYAMGDLLRVVKAQIDAF